MTWFFSDRKFSDFALTELSFCDSGRNRVIIYIAVAAPNGDFGTQRQRKVRLKTNDFPGLAITKPPFLARRLSTTYATLIIVSRNYGFDVAGH